MRRAAAISRTTASASRSRPARRNPTSVPSTHSSARCLRRAQSPARSTAPAAFISRNWCERLGIADAVNAKASRQPGGLCAEQLIDGRADIAIQQVPELLAAGKGIELAGLLPAELQKMSVLSAGVFKSSAQAAAGRTFIGFLAKPEAARSFKAAGFDPF